MSPDASQLNSFVDNTFNRLAEKRENSSWLEQALASPDTRFISVWRNHCAVESATLRLDTRQAFDEAQCTMPILLGEVDGSPCFALDLGDTKTPPQNQSDWTFINLRTIGTEFDTQNAALGAYAQAMIFWHRTHSFCGSCGSRTINMHSGHARDCSNLECGRRSFPRTDPAVIVAAYCGDRILLGRQAAWPAGRYSTIAGFVEPGESLEMAVRREVAEETGHTVDSVKYLSSQPWPFPSSQMLGFIANISEQAHCATDEELEDIQWFSREQILQLERHGPKLLPPPISIAYRLIEHWFNLDSEEKLEELLS